MSSEDEEDSDQDLLVLMEKKQKKKATQEKKISQKTCAAENEEKETCIDCCSCNPLTCACNDEDSESNSISLEANLKINDESNFWDQFKRRESILKDVISRLNEQIETMKGQIEMYQRLQDKVTNHSEGLEAEIISLKADLEASNKKNEKLLQSFEKEGREVEIISLKTDLEKSNKKNEELLQIFEEQENGLKEEILNLNDQVEEGKRVE